MAAQTTATQLENLAINTIRTLSIDSIERANSGHPGLPMGAAPMAFTLWTECMNHNPGNPEWFNRDRFVLSAGHGSMLLYSLLHLTGYDLSLEELQNFRQWGSKTPGHPNTVIRRASKQQPVRLARDLQWQQAWLWQSAIWQPLTIKAVSRL